MKGKIISFSPHRRRGLIMVHVKGEEGMEYQHLQFDSKHYDSSIETHLYKDQSVDVSLLNIKPGIYKVEKIYYDIGRHLYKRSRPEKPPRDQEQSRRDRDRVKKKNFKSTRQQSGSRKNFNNQKAQQTRSSDDKRKREYSRRPTENREKTNKNNRQKNTVETSERRLKTQRTYKGSKQRYSQNIKNKEGGKFQFRHKEQKDQRKNRRAYGRRRYRERQRFLAFFLYYRRVKLQKIKSIKQFQRNRIQLYRRRNRLMTFS